MITEVEQTWMPGSESGMAYFYCRYNDPLRNNYEAIAKGLISQLLKSNHNCLQYVFDVVLKSGERHASTKKLFPEMLSNMVLCYDQVFIGIDGLDECEPAERKQTLSLLHSLLTPLENVSKVKILLSSCAEKDIERSIRPCKNLQLKPQYLSIAIESYVRMRLAKLNERFRFSAARLEEIILRIANQSSGKGHQ